jgi:hypothetical protein
MEVSQVRGEGGEHGKKAKLCDGRHQCQGLICECWEDDDAIGSEEENHGVSFENPCKRANCYPCGWGGTLPATPKGLAPFEKKALEAMPGRKSWASRFDVESVLTDLIEMLGCLT